MDITGKVALVTGASSGIGEATALELGARRARVALTARRRDRLEAVAERVRKAGGDALVAPADVRSEEELLSAFDAATERWGTLDILINNAGIGRSASLIDGAAEDWRAMLEVNVLAVTIAAREALRRFDPEAGGHIVNVASLSGHRVPPKGGFYPATKFAVRALTEALRLELRAAGNPTRVSQVSPGFVDTEFVEGYAEEDRRQLRERMSRIRILSPGDVASSIIHVLEAPDPVAVHDVLLRSREQAT